jgi:hypothetical protein
MFDFWEKGKNPLGETTAIINCPKSGHITPHQTIVNTYLEKVFGDNLCFASPSSQTFTFRLAESFAQKRSFTPVSEPGAVATGSPLG